jgi:hypothetical protein
VSRQIKLYDGFGATRWLKLSTWASKGAEADPEARELVLVRRAENREKFR